MSRPHLIYLAFFFPPSRASGVYRAIATCNAFVARGWDVTVITCNREFFEDEIGSTDESLIDLVDPSVEVIRVRYSFDHNKKKFEEIGFLEANFPEVFSTLRNRFETAINFQRVLGGRSPNSHQISDRYSAWIDPVVRAGLKTSRNETKHILATGNPFSSFVAARWLGMVLGIDYSIDFRDPWSFDVFTSQRLEFNSGIHPVEREVVRDAAHCFHVNEAIADAYRLAYPSEASKQHVAMNGFDLRAQSRPVHRERSAEVDEFSIVFGILGTVNDRWPLEEIFRAWQSLRRELGSGCRFKLGGHLGYFARGEGALRDFLPLEEDGFEYVGPVENQSVDGFYSKIDVVVLPVPGGKMVTSGKVFEAGVLGKPIVCVQEKSGGARALLSTHPLFFGAEPHHEDILEAMNLAAMRLKLVDDEDRELIANWARPFERIRAIQPLVDRISMRV